MCCYQLCHARIILICSVSLDNAYKLCSRVFFLGGFNPLRCHIFPRNPTQAKKIRNEICWKMVGLGAVTLAKYMATHEKDKSCLDKFVRVIRHRKRMTIYWIWILGWCWMMHADKIRRKRIFRFFWFLSIYANSDLDPELKQRIEKRKLIALIQAVNAFFCSDHPGLSRIVCPKCVSHRSRKETSNFQLAVPLNRVFVHVEGSFRLNLTVETVISPCFYQSKASRWFTDAT